MKVITIGDSTMQFNSIYKYPQTGWPQMLPLFLKANTVIENYAKNGRSTKSFIDEGRFAHVLTRIEKGDYVLCEFGHNDEKIADPNRYTRPNVEYVNNLKYMADEVTKRGGNIIFLTPICRHNFVEGICIETHREYRLAMLDFCQKNNYLCIDMDELTRKAYTDLGEAETLRFHMIFKENTFMNYPEGKDDHTHLSPEGALNIAKIFIEAISNTNSSFKELILPIEGKDEFDLFMLQD